MKVISLTDAIEIGLLNEDGTDGNNEPLTAAWDSPAWQHNTPLEEAWLEVQDDQSDENRSAKIFTANGEYAYLDRSGLWEYYDCVTSWSDSDDDLDFLTGTALANRLALNAAIEESFKVTA